METVVSEEHITSTFRADVNYMRFRNGKNAQGRWQYDYPLYRSTTGLDRWGKISSPPGFDPRTVQPVTSRYTDCVTRPTPPLYSKRKLYLISGIFLLLIYQT
jgi:hypothetical protein